jgi:hypothetical protein
MSRTLIFSFILFNLLLNISYSQSGYFKRVQVVDSLYVPTRINSSAYYLNGVLSTSLSLDTSSLPRLNRLNIFTGYKNTFKSIYLTSGGNDTIKVTDDYGLVIATADSPRVRIDNRGNVYLPDTTFNNPYGSIFKGNTRFISTFHPDSSSGYNTFVGMNSGNFTMNNSNVAMPTYKFLCSYNTSLGFGTLSSLTTGYYNCAFGYNAGTAITTGGNNFPMGAFSLSALTTGSSNTTIGGQSALYLGTSSSFNTGIGSNVLTGVNGQSVCHVNIGIGSSSLYSLKTGANRNIAIGIASLYSLTTGYGNIMIGNQSSDIYGTVAFTTARRIQTGSFNILIGDTVYTTDSSSSRQLNIGKTIYGTGIYTDTARIGIEAINPHSTFQDSGSFALQYVSKTANYTVGEKDYCINFTTAGDTAFLPTAVGKQGRIYVIKNSAASGTVVVDGLSTQTIDGVTTKSLTTQYSRVTIMSDNANWIILSE